MGGATVDHYTVGFLEALGEGVSCDCVSVGLYAIARWVRVGRFPLVGIDSGSHDEETY